MDGTYLRQAVVTDVDAVAALEARCFDEPWASTAFEQFVAAPGFLVAIDSTDEVSTPDGGPPDGSLLAYVVTTAAADAPRSVAHVRNLAVVPSERRRGLARRLLTASLSPYRQAGYDRVRLEVRESNAPARALYRDVGFAVVDRREGYYRDGETAVVMSASLDTAGH